MVVQSNDRTMAEIRTKLEELRDLKQRYQADADHYENNPGAAYANWWKGYEDHIKELDNEIANLKRKL